MDDELPVEWVVRELMSFCAVLLEVSSGTKRVAQATGVTVVKAKGTKFFVLTNWHVVTGVHPDTRERLGPAPDSLWISLHSRVVGKWRVTEVPLYSVDGERRWVEHPAGAEVDVVAVPVDVPDDALIYGLDPSLADVELALVPSEVVSIVGFPFGLLSETERFPIWKTGHIATEPGVDFLGRPVFLVDATTRQGMSGSPVVAKRVGAYEPKPGTLAISDTGVVKFLGLYSARHDERLDPSLGYVWKARVITELFAAADLPDEGA